MKKLIIVFVIFFLIQLSLIIFGSDNYSQTYINAIVMILSILGVLTASAFIVEKDEKCKKELEKFANKFWGDDKR